MHTLTNNDSSPVAQFSALADGSVKGDGGRYSQLAASLRYAARLADQVGETVGLGDFVSLDTVSTTRLTVWADWDDAHDANLRVRVSRVAMAEAREFTILGEPDGPAAVRQALQAMNAVPGVLWSALYSADSRVVGAARSAQGQGTTVQLGDLPDVGSRARGVIGALDEPYRLGFVRLAYSGGLMLVASVGPHFLFTMAEASADEAAVGDAVDQMRAFVGPYDLLDVPAVVQRRAQPTTPAEAVVAAPSPVGLRFRR